MKSLLREYGLILILIVVAMVGYLMIQGQEEDILARSLDGIRNRLVAMVDDATSREAIAAHFDRFKDKVQKQEVPPEEVENIAANVLNLSNSGSTITPEQAEMMLDFASAAPEATLLPMPEPSAAPLAPPTPLGSPEPTAPPTPRDLTTLGERLDVMLAFNVEVEKVMDERRDQREEMARYIRYRSEEGLHIDLDMAMTDEMKQRIAHEAQRFEAKRMMVVWKENMAEEMQVERERAQRALRSVEALKNRPSRDVRVAVAVGDLESLESLKHLEAMGYRALLSDSVHRVIMVHLEEALEAAHEDIEEAMEAQDEALEDQMEEWEEYLEEVEEALEELEEELHDALEELEEEDDEDEDEDDEGDEDDEDE